MKSKYSIFFLVGYLALVPACSKEKQPAELPEIMTIPPSDINWRGARVGGKVINDGEANILDKGVAWSTSQYPTPADDYKMSAGEGPDEFSRILVSLLPDTRYFVRAYATNKAGTGYGMQFDFTTTPIKIPGEGVTDIDGNEYKTVIIGNQEWMAENLRVNNYSDGTPIEDDEDINNDNKFGRLYSWETAMNNASQSNSNPSGVQGACPAGWHIPSDSQWEELINYLEINFNLINYFESPTRGVGNALKAARQVDHPWEGEHATYEHPRWETHDRHYGSDDFGFSALPGDESGTIVYWLSTTAWNWAVYNSRSDIEKRYWSPVLSHVRCVRVLSLQGE